MKSKRSLFVIAAIYFSIILIIILVSLFLKKDKIPVTSSREQEGTVQTDDLAQDISQSLSASTAAQKKTQIPDAAGSPTLAMNTSTPSAQPSPTTTNSIVQQATATLTTASNLLLSPVPTNTLSVPATPLPSETEIITPVEWAGTWTAFFGDEGGLLFRATLIISRSGNDITGVHSTQTFTGRLSDDGLSVTGTWFNPPMSGTFSWTIIGDNQFCGNTDNVFAYCAARNGASRPDPCICVTPDD
jgi:hypothetical protein